MNLLLRGVLILLVMNLACSRETEEKEPEEIKMEGQLSIFSCSDSSLNQMYEGLANNFNAKADLDQAKWKELLTYFRPARPLLEEAEGRDAIDMLWTAYLQTENKVLITDHPIWNSDFDSAFAKPDSLAEQFLLHQSYQRAAYLAIATQKDSLAKLLLDKSNQIFQEHVKNQFDKEKHSFGQGLDADILALSMDLVPEKQAKAIIRNLMDQLLQGGMSLKGLGLGKQVVLPLLSQHEQNEMAFRLLPEVSEPLAARWLISELAGIKPSLNAPGFSQPILQPRLGGDLEFVEGQLKTQYGLLYVRIEDRKPMRLQVRVPAKATLVLPVEDPTRATILANNSRLWMGGSPQPSPPGITFRDVRKEGIVVELARGKYNFQIKN